MSITCVVIQSIHGRSFHCVYLEKFQSSSASARPKPVVKRKICSYSTCVASCWPLGFLNHGTRRRRRMAPCTASDGDLFNACYLLCPQFYRKSKLKYQVTSVTKLQRCSHAVLGIVVDRLPLSRRYCTSLLTHASCQQCDQLYTDYATQPSLNYIHTYIFTCSKLDKAMTKCKYNK